jgi:hypothetical protein
MWEVPGAKLGWAASYSDVFFLDFLSLIRACLNTSKALHTYCSDSFFHVI